MFNLFELFEMLPVPEQRCPELAEGSTGNCISCLKSHPVGHDHGMNGPGRALSVAKVSFITGKLQPSAIFPFLAGAFAVVTHWRKSIFFRYFKAKMG